MFSLDDETTANMRHEDRSKQIEHDLECATNTCAVLKFVENLQMKEQKPKATGVSDCQQLIFAPAGWIACAVHAH